MTIAAMPKLQTLARDTPVVEEAEAYYMRTKLARFWINAHNWYSSKNQLRLPQHDPEIHRHCPSGCNIIWPCLDTRNRCNNVTNSNKNSQDYKILCSTSFASFFNEWFRESTKSLHHYSHEKLVAVDATILLSDTQSKYVADL